MCGVYLWGIMYDASTTLCKKEIIMCMVAIFMVMCENKKVPKNFKIKMIVHKRCLEKD